MPAALPLDAIRERSKDGWIVRLRVHAERITVTKEVVVTERVVLRRNLVDDVVHIEAVVQREQLRVETEGTVGTTYLADHVSNQDTDRLTARQGLPWRRDEHETLARTPHAMDELEEPLL